MNFKIPKIGVIVAGLAVVSGIIPVSAGLPTMETKAWLGYFVGFENKKFQFGITSEGKAAIKIIGKKGEPLSQDLTIPVNFLIQETLPDGKVIDRKIKPESLESAQVATDKPQNVVFHGSVTGDAGFEVFVDEENGGISLGGRLLDAGKLKNPVRFLIELKIPDAYSKAKKDGDKKQVKAFEEKIKKDRLQLAWTDKTRVKLELSDKVDADSKEINGPGIAAAQIEIAAYDDKQIQVTASEASVLQLSGNRERPLHEGFSFIWAADPEKDPENKARLRIEVK